MGYLDVRISVQSDRDSKRPNRPRNEENIPNMREAMLQDTKYVGKVLGDELGRVD